MVARGAPGANVLDGAVEVAVLAPLRVEVHRHARDGDVVHQRGEHVGVPHLVDVLAGWSCRSRAHRRTAAIRSSVRSASATIAAHDVARRRRARRWRPRPGRTA